MFMGFLVTIPYLGMPNVFDAMGPAISLQNHDVRGPGDAAPRSSRCGEMRSRFLPLGRDWSTPASRTRLTKGILQFHSLAAKDDVPRIHNIVLVQSRFYKILPLLPDFGWPSYLAVDPDYRRGQQDCALEAYLLWHHQLAWTEVPPMLQFSVLLLSAACSVWARFAGTASTIEQFARVRFCITLTQ